MVDWSSAVTFRGGVGLGALGALAIMRYTNLHFTYLLTYFGNAVVFNVGEYRRRVVNNFTNSAQFFHPDNIEANAIRE